MPPRSPSVNAEPANLLSPNYDAAFQGKLSAFFSEILADPVRRRIADQGARPLIDHVADYRAELVAKGDTAKWTEQTIRQVFRVIRLCSFAARTPGRGPATWSTLTPAGIRMALHKLGYVRPRRMTRGPSTINAYMHSIKAFANWMVNDYRAERSPCRGLRCLSKETDIRRRRRALSPAEIIRLIDAANKGNAVSGIPGQERAMMYVLALTTGLRASELESLTPTSFRLERDNPHVVLEAAFSKHRRRDVVPLRADVAELVKVYLAQRVEPPPMPRRYRRIHQLFRRPPSNQMRAMRIDLAAAGIPYVVDGEYADFHAHRHTFISNLFDAGATPKEVQTLARHQDARLTLGRYAHVTPGAQRSAVERLPSMSTPAMPAAAPIADESKGEADDAK